MVSKAAIAKGRKTQKPEGFTPSNNSSGYEPEGRMIASTPNKVPIGLDNRGKEIKEVWVKGQKYQIIFEEKSVRLCFNQYDRYILYI